MVLRRKYSVLLVTAIMLAAGLACGGIALAITFGQPDGNKHPNVGALVGTFDGETYPYCSGTLISSTVFLTAAHCDIGTSTLYVTFDSEYTSKSRLYSGTFYAHPEFNQSQSDPHDIAVVVFDKPIRGITPAKLPTLGQFEVVAKDQQFTAVDYRENRIDVTNTPTLTVVAVRD